VQRQYQLIGGGSPIRKWTEAQAELLVKKLDQTSPETAPHKWYIAFRYAAPLTEHTLDQVARDRPSRVVAFTQYPQYSCTTTGSSLNELLRQLNKNTVSIRMILYNSIDCSCSKMTPDMSDRVSTKTPKIFF
jgi:ferrochelatase